MDTPPDVPALLEVRGLSKSFPGVRALDGVDLTVRAGEVHALMGENGAGKSTLIRVLTGLHRRDSGTVRLSGRAISPASPAHAEALGISAVHQEVHLIPHLSVAENICLGREPTRLGRIRWGEVRRRAGAALGRLGLSFDVDRELAGCSTAVRQLVAIARALDTESRLLILDEPTSSLDAGEVAELFAVLRRLRAGGLGIIFITHFLDQVYAISDRITVLRDGRLVGEFRAAELPRLELVGRMIGREVAAEGPVVGGPVAATDGPLLEARGLSRRGGVEHADVAVAPGEAVGLAGLLGSGRTETARMLFGIDRPDRGRMFWRGRAFRPRSPRRAIRRGLAFTPESRKDEGIIPSLSVRENIILALQAQRGALRPMGRGAQRALAERLIRALNIKTPGQGTPVRNLSGGNQQKVLLARWLATDPALLILDEPTRGIDIGARAEIERLIERLRREGRGILLISSELDEIVRSCTRVVVLRDRRTVGELSGARISERAILELIAAHEH